MKARLNISILVIKPVLDLEFPALLSTLKTQCLKSCAKNHQYRLHPRIGPQDPLSVATAWPPLFLGYAASQRSMSLGALGLAGAVGAEQSDLV